MPKTHLRNVSRRSLLAGALASPFLNHKAWPQNADPSLLGFPGTRFRDYSKCLPDYLGTLAQEAVDIRAAALKKLSSPTEVAPRQVQVREVLWNLIGGPEKRTSLNANTAGELTRSRYRIEKVSFESQPNLFVSANLYVPAGSGPFPAVLFQCGHYWEGKAYPSYQRCCQGLVQLGFVVLAFDPIGQGERINYLTPDGNKSRLSSCDAEHTVPGKQLILFGDSMTRLQLWDAIRALDYLLSLSYVDANRLASVGHSGGGTLTMLLAGADERLAAAAVCMGNAENIIQIPFRPPGATDDAEQDFVYSGPVGFDRWDLFYPFAPKPMLIWPSDRDFFATYSPDYLKNGWQEFQHLKRTYEVLNAPKRISWADTPLPHALAYDSRMLIYNWFCGWLKSGESVAEEPPVKPEPVQSLWATPNGSVVRDLRSITPHTLVSSRRVEKSPKPLRDLLKINSSISSGNPTQIGQVKSRNIDVEILEISSDPGVWLPAFLIRGDRTLQSSPVLLVLDERDNDRLWFAPEVDQILTEDTPLICAAGLRGIGSQSPQFSPGAAEYEAWHEQEENYAWASLALGKPLIGQRVQDILAWVNALRTHPVSKAREIYVAALGKLTVPALFAAALAPEIRGLYLADGLASFSDLVQTEIPNHSFANYVPGLLKHTDLPDVTASLSPRRVTLAGTVTASGKRMNSAIVRKIYAAGVSAGNVVQKPSSEWSAKGLIAYLLNETDSQR